MEIKTVFHADFAEYGRIVMGHDFEPLFKQLAKTTLPADGVIYVASAPELEATEEATVLADHVYGGMPIQIGYCNGTNYKLNCFEYHRDSEVNLCADDVILLVARQQDISDRTLDTSYTKAFLAPAGSAVELYATTLHYAPCSAKTGKGFRVAVVLPRGTNTDKPEMLPRSPEDALLWARNKWLIAHSDTAEAAQGAFVGLVGENIDLSGAL